MYPHIIAIEKDILDPEYYSSMFKRPSGELLFTKYRDRAAAVPFSQDIEAMNDELEDLGIIGERYILCFIRHYHNHDGPALMLPHFQATSCLRSRSW